MLNPLLQSPTRRAAYILFAILLVSFTACDSSEQKDASASDSGQPAWDSTISKSIRSDVDRINSITTWTSVDTVTIEESTEGGMAVFFYTESRPEKVVVWHAGEMGQTLEEYYLLNNELRFVLERQYGYNRPIYYDSAAMRENNDTTSFHVTESKVTEYTNYFHGGKLVHRASNDMDAASTPASDLSKEETRIKDDFDRIMKSARK